MKIDFCFGQCADGASSLFQQPTILAALVTAGVTIVVLTVTTVANARSNRSKIGADIALANRRFDYDRELAERKFEYDRNLQIQKVASEKELKIWQQKVAFAEGALAEFHEAKSKMTYVRSPFSPAGEGADRKGRDDENPDTQKRRDVYYPVWDRLSKQSDFFNRLQVQQKYRAIALFGTAAAEPYDTLRSATFEVQIAAQILLSHYCTDGVRESNAEAVRGFENKIWSGTTAEDKIEAEVNKALDLAEKLFGDVLRTPPRLDNRTHLTA